MKEPKRIFDTLWSPSRHKIRFVPLEVKLSSIILIAIIFVYAQTPTLFPEALSQIVRNELTFYLILILIASLYLKKKPLDRVTAKRAVWELGIFAFLTWFVLLGLYSVSEALFPIQVQITPLLTTVPALAYTMFFIGAYSEEMFFRGFLQNEFGVVITSFIFSGIHLHFLQAGLGLFPFIVLFLFSIIVGVIHAKFKSIYPAVGTHFTFNLFMAVI